MSKELTNQLVLERYKFIQDKIKFLDNVLHINMNLVIKILIGIFTVILSIFLIHLKQPDLVSPQAIIIALQFSSALVALTTFVFLLMTIANVLSWIDYRKEEVELLEKFGGEFIRKPADKKKFLSWQETWFSFALLFILIVSIVGWVCGSTLVQLILSS